MGAFFDGVKKAGSNARAATEAGARDVSRLFTAPRLLLVWLLRSHTAQVAGLLLFLLMPLLSDLVVSWIHSSARDGGLMGSLMEVSGVKRMRLAARQEEVRFYIYWAAGLLTAWAFWISIPAAVARGERIAEDRERDADELAGHKPSEAIPLYREAFAYASDTDHRLSILRKISKLDARMAAATMSTDASADPGRTVALAPGEAPAQCTERYRLVAELGRGAMGVVWRARDTVLDRDVALKELPPALSAQPGLLDRLRREAKALARMSHPGIVQVYDFVEGAGRAWIVMELVEGEDLEQVLYREVRLEAPDALACGIAMAEALAYAHQKGILHRDLKPANVIRTPEGGVKIMDFGVSKLAESSLATQEGTLLGSPAYMSPEQASGRPLDERSDLYAFGTVLYRMLVGRTPFEGDVMAVIAQILTKDPPTLRSFIPDIPSAIEEVVMRCLAKEPSERYSNLTDAAGALRYALSTVQANRTS